MDHRAAAVLVTVVLILGIARTHVSAQTEQVQLRLRLQAGEGVFYTVSTVSQQTLEIAGREATSERRTEMREAIRVLDVAGDGSATVERVWDDGAPLVMLVRPDGRVAELRVGSGKPDALPVRLPAGPLAVGDSWEYRTDGDASIRYALTLAGINRVGDERVANIRYTLSGSSATRNTRETLRGRGEIQWAVDQGRMVRSSEEVTLEILLYFTTPSGTLPVRQTVRGTQRREPLAPPSPAAVDAARLIVPGKAIGELNMAMTLDAIMARHGVGDRTQTPGLRAVTLAWLDPQIPRAYIDGSDPPKLLGLHTAHPSYLTEKGIAFGSSEGAVLFAYGMSPVRVEMSIPNMGGVRMLVYDDQGIAFAVTSDKQHAERGGSHAPVGAVDWIVIFAPGDAAKIFPMP